MTNSSPATNAAIERGASPIRMTTYAWYVAGALAIAHVISIMDRYLLSVVLEHVKADLTLSDTQLGILQGPAFVALFAAASLPLGRWADTANRKWMVVWAVTFWSAATVACGLADTFGQLLAARLAVGLGEAALVPAAMSLIAAFFTPDRLSRGISVYTAGGSLGRVAGFAGGGAVLALAASDVGVAVWLRDLGMAPWHTVFLTAGVVGVGVALLLAITLREPPRRTVTGPRTGYRSAFRHFATNRRAYLATIMPFAMVNAMTQMLTAWAVSLYAREHGASAATAAALIGTASLFGGPAGHIVGGWLNDRLAAAGVKAVQPMVFCLILIAAPAVVVAFILNGSLIGATVLYGIAYFLLSLSGPTGYTGVQAATPDALRGVITGILLILYILLGNGLGPLTAGVLGDAMGGDGALGAALLTGTGIFAVVGLLFAATGRRQFQVAVEYARDSNDAPSHG